MAYADAQAEDAVIQCIEKMRYSIHMSPLCNVVQDIELVPHPEVQMLKGEKQMFLHAPLLVSPVVLTSVNALLRESRVHQILVLVLFSSRVCQRLVIPLMAS